MLTFKRGEAYATRYADAYARLWRLIFASCDDSDCPQDDIELLWIPAHTTEADVGVARLSDGRLLTAADRTGNGFADELAKRGAEIHRLPEPVRQAVARRHDLAAWAARELAVRTCVANSCPLGGGQVCGRDSEGLPTWRRRQGQRKRPPPPQPPAPAPPPLLPAAEVHSDSSCSSSASSAPTRDQQRAHRRRQQAIRRARSESACLQALVERCHAGARPPAASAAERMAAIRSRVQAKALG